MTVREVLKAFGHGVVTIDEAEQRILYQCEDCEYLGPDPDCEDGDEEELDSVEAVIRDVDAIPPEERQAVLDQLRKLS